MKKFIFDIAEQNIFFTSDLHLSHENILLYCSRPFETVGHMNTILIANWNTIVKEEDIVFILGDFHWGNKQEWKKTLTLLNGRKYLILGNHDKESKIPSETFEDVMDLCDVRIIDSRIGPKEHVFILSHRPFLTWEGRETRNVKHLFGHVHTLSRNSIKLENSTRETDHDIYSQIKPTQMYDVGVDNNDYTPVSFKQLQTYFNLI